MEQSNFTGKNYNKFFKKNRKMDINKEPYVTVYTVTYNEEHMIEFFIRHYRKMFPNCIIKVFDNYSTDRTVEIAKSFDCEIKYFQSIEGKDVFDDREHTKIKNNEWKSSTTDWVICCDCDELLQITQEELIKEEEYGVNIITSEGWHMINNISNDIDLPNMENGWQDNFYSKHILFNTKYIYESNFAHGCHTGNPGPNPIYSKNKYVLSHYKFISKEFSLKKRFIQDSRFSNWSRKTWASGCALFRTDEYWDNWYNKPLTNIRHLMK
jgi:glycosyltransferase involved in cell wall biosynthesis